MFTYHIIFSFLLVSSLLTSLELNAQLDKSKIDALLENMVTEDAPGISVSVMQNGELIYQNQRGLADLENQVPLNDATAFGIASVTKQFTAACIGILQKQGKLNIEDNVTKYIPEMARFKSDIKIKNLLDHTSGLRNHNVLLDLKGFDYANESYNNEDIEQLSFSQFGVNFTAGKKMNYTNTNYVMLALIIERVAKQPFENFAKKMLFEPLGLEHTAFKVAIEQVFENKAHQYAFRQGKYTKYTSLSLCIGAGGITSTAQDLLKWAKIYMDQSHPYYWLGKFLTKKCALNDGTFSDYAKGVFVNDYKGMKTIHHGGADFGLSTQLMILPEKALAIVVLINSNRMNAASFSYQIIDEMYPKEVKTKETEKQTIPASHYQKFVGDYQEINSDMGMKIWIENDTVRAQSSMGRHIVPLVAVDSSTLARWQNSQVQHQFATQANVDYDMAVDFSGAKFYFEKVKLISRPIDNLQQYIGEYYSEELDIKYKLAIKDKQLSLSYRNNENIPLKSGQIDEFGSGRRTRYRFLRDSKGEITSFTVAAEGTVKDILFLKN